jgi:hypothetical protein
MALTVIQQREDRAGGRVDRHQFGQHLIGAVLVEYAGGATRSGAGQPIVVRRKARAEGCSTSGQSEGSRQARGFSIVGSALDQAKAEALKARLAEVADDLEAAGASTHTAIIDPNRANCASLACPITIRISSNSCRRLWCAKWSKPAWYGPHQFCNSPFLQDANSGQKVKMTNSPPVP